MTVNSKVSKQSNQTHQTQMQHFREQVFYWVNKIPKGKVTSYGTVAKLAGFPRHARHVSKALGAAPKSQKIPWFRVIGSDRKIAFHPDSDAYAIQVKQLEDEGIIFKNGKVLQEHFWKPYEDSSQGLSVEEFFK